MSDPTTSRSRGTSKGWEEREFYPPEALGVSIKSRSLDEQRGCLAKATLPMRRVFRLNAEAQMNSAVALQRQPYLGVGYFG